MRAPSRNGVPSAPPGRGFWCGVAQLVERRIVNPVVVGSSPTATASSNNFHRKHLAAPSSPAHSTVSAQVSNRASNRRRDLIVSRHFEPGGQLDGVLASSPTHGPKESDLPDRACRVTRGRTTDDREWSRLGLFPEPKECLPDRVILYDRDEVRHAIEQRKAARRRRAAPGSRHA
jgi:hypothetical protein